MRSFNILQLSNWMPKYILISQIEHGMRVCYRVLEWYKSQQRNLITCQVLRMLYTNGSKVRNNENYSHIYKSAILEWIKKESYDSNIVTPPTTKYPIQNPNKNVVDGVDTYLNVLKLVQPHHQDQRILLSRCLCKGYEQFTWTF